MLIDTFLTLVELYICLFIVVTTQYNVPSGISAMYVAL